MNEIAALLNALSSAVWAFNIWAFKMTLRLIGVKID